MATSLNSGGKLTAAARADTTGTMKLATATATPTCTETNLTRANRKIKIRASGSAGNPVSVEPFTPTIDYHLDIEIDLGDPLNPTYSIAGGTDGFPSYEVYINNQRIYGYSEAGHSPLELVGNGSANPVSETGAIQ